jgi:hypothetical protein
MPINWSVYSQMHESQDLWKDEKENMWQNF